MGTAFGAVLTQIWSTIGQVVSTITDSALLLVPLGLAFAAGVIGLAKSLMGTKRRRR